MALLLSALVPHPPLILPAVGRGDEARVAATQSALRRLAQRIATLAPQTIIIVTPHARGFADAWRLEPGDRHGRLRGDFGRFGAPQLQFEAAIDADMNRAIIEAARELDEGLPIVENALRGESLDHGSMIPIAFLEEAGLAPDTYGLVRLAYAAADAAQAEALGRVLARAIAATGRRCVYIASGDLSHRLLESGPYGFDEAGPVFDAAVGDAVRANDPRAFLEITAETAEAAGHCGLTALQVLAGLVTADGPWEGTSELLSYEGPFGVGYAVACFDPSAKSPAAAAATGDPYVALARETIRAHVLGEAPRPTPELPGDERAACFVTLYREGRLRGCIGTLEARMDSLAEEIRHNAVAAATEDPRFAPLSAAELEGLAVSVDVLSAPEPVEDVRELDPARYGVIVSAGARRGVLLPDLDGVDDVETQLDIARDKAGIAASEPYAIERFEVRRHHD